MPASVGGSARSRAAPNTVALLVMNSMRLACRCNKLVMTRPCAGPLHARPNARDVGEDFVALLEPVVAFENDHGRRVPRKRITEQIEGLVGHRMAVRIGKE